MRPHEIEAWALRAVDRVLARQPLEDSLLEAKATWTDPASAARRIAGHCNAARGAPVLWVIGLNERDGTVPGADANDLANWWPQVRSHFDGPAPRLIDQVVHAPAAVVVALLFETDRAPFVVRNPVHNQPGGGPVALEVPWREGTSVRSAKHADLIRILSPLSTVPRVELVEGRLSILQSGGLTPSGHDGPSWSLELKLFVTPRGSRAAFPLHRTRVTWRAGSMAAPIESRYPTFSPFVRGYVGPSRPLPENVLCTDSEAVVRLPGVLSVKVEKVAADYVASPGDVAMASLFMHDADSDQPVSIDATLALVGAEGSERARFECLPFGIRL